MTLKSTLKRLIPFTPIVLATTLAYAQTIRYIAEPHLPDIAMASYDASGPIILYNPSVVARTDPDVVQFFKKHEEGHHALGHLQRALFEANSWNRAWVSQSYEREADCYATKQLATTNPSAIDDTISFFEHHPEQVDWYHPPGYERAAVIRSCKGTTISGLGNGTPALANSSLFCTTLAQYVAARSTDFSTLKGASDGDGDYTSKVSLPNSKWCDVMLSEGTPIDHYITCSMNENYSTLVGRVAACYPSLLPEEKLVTSSRRTETKTMWTISDSDDNRIEVMQFVLTSSPSDRDLFVTVD